MKRPILFLIPLLTGCGMNPKGDATQTNAPTKTHHIESGITWVGRYEIVEAGMKYVVYREIDGGLFILNISKDSLEYSIMQKSSQ